MLLSITLVCTIDTILQLVPLTMYTSMKSCLHAALHINKQTDVVDKIASETYEEPWDKHAIPNQWYQASSSGPSTCTLHQRSQEFHCIWKGLRQSQPGDWPEDRSQPTQE